MSTLDDAFIKAYRKGRATMGAYAGQAAPPPAEPRVAAAHPTVPPPHVNLASFAQASAEPGANRAHAGDSSSRPRAAVRPAFEVRQFNWPRLIAALAGQAAAELQAAMDLLGARISQGRRTLLVTGCARGEGRSTMLLALAYAASLRGLRTALVDFDFGHPNLADQLGLAPQIGAEALAEHQIPVAEALIESASQGLTLLPLLRPLAEPGAGDAPGSWRAAVGELRNEYELVLIDSSPLDSDAAALELATALGEAPIDDALVVHTRETAGENLRLVGKRLAAARVRHWDLAENFVRIRV